MLGPTPVFCNSCPRCFGDSQRETSPCGSQPLRSIKSDDHRSDELLRTTGQAISTAPPVAQALGLLSTSLPAIATALLSIEGAKEIVLAPVTGRLGEGIIRSASEASHAAAEIVGHVQVDASVLSIPRSVYSGQPRTLNFGLRQIAWDSSLGHLRNTALAVQRYRRVCPATESDDQISRQVVACLLTGRTQHYCAHA